MLELFQRSVSKLAPFKTTEKNHEAQLRRRGPSAVVSRLCRAAGTRMLHHPMCIENWHRKMKMRAFANFAFYPDASAVRFDQVFGDGQTASRAARLAN